MKKNVLIGILSLLLFAACRKEKHSVRFVNEYSEAMIDLGTGQNSFGPLNPGGITAYQSIPSGTFSIYARTSNQELKGTGLVSGKGTHKWTIIIEPQGTLSVNEDK